MDATVLTLHNHRRNVRVDVIQQICGQNHVKVHVCHTHLSSYPNSQDKVPPDKTLPLAWGLQKVILI
jgi:hypothetical protein